MLYFVNRAVDALMSHRFSDDEGATAVEYGVMVALVVAVIIVIVTSVGQKLVPGFETVDSGL